MVCGCKANTCSDRLQQVHSVDSIFLSLTKNHLSIVVVTNWAVYLKSNRHCGCIYIFVCTSQIIIIIFTNIFVQCLRVCLSASLVELSWVSWRDGTIILFERVFANRTIYNCTEFWSAARWIIVITEPRSNKYIRWRRGH